MKRIVYTRASDGGTSIVQPAPDGRFISVVKWGDGALEEFPAGTCLDRIKLAAEALGKPFEVIKGETEDEQIQRVRLLSVPVDAIKVRVVDESEIPPRDEFRNALQNDLTHDMVKAREILRGHMRVTRAPLLFALDVEFQRADEVGDEAAKKSVAARKQVLRDVTSLPDIEAAKTIAALKAIRPDCLAAAPMVAA